MKKMIIVGFAVGFLLILLTINANAERLLTEEEALKEMLPGAERVEKITHSLTDEELERILTRIKTMVLHQQGSESKNVDESRNYDFFFGYKNNKKFGVAIFDRQPGKWGPVSFVLALDPENAKVQNLAVTAYTEKRGRPIALKSFTSQFVGKTSKDPIEVNNDILSISGATISCRSAAFVVRKIITLYEEVFLTKPLIDRLKDIEYYSVRIRALAELRKLDKLERDKFLDQLIRNFIRNETDERYKMTTIFALNAFVNPEMVVKLESIKFSKKTSFNGNLEEVLNKLTEIAGIKLIWLSDELKSAATQIKLTEMINPVETDNFWSVLESVLIRYGCSFNRKIKDDNLPFFTYSLRDNSIEIIDESAAQKQWQAWWKNYNSKFENHNKD